MNAPRMAVWATLASAGLLGSASATDPGPDPSHEVSIPFVGHLAINDWVPDKAQGIWIQDEHRRWYYARFRDPCLGLQFANTIAFDTRPGGPLDRFGSIIPPHEAPCHFQSLVRSDPPPKKVKRVPAKDKA